MGSKLWSFSTNNSFAADASNTVRVVFNSENVPDGIFVLCHDYNLVIWCEQFSFSTDNDNIFSDFQGVPEV